MSDNNKNIPSDFGRISDEFSIEILTGSVSSLDVEFKRVVRVIRLDCK